MSNWLKQLKFDPIEPLLASSDAALRYFTIRDIAGEAVEPIQTISQLPEIKKLLFVQLDNGSFKHIGNKPEVYYPPNHYEIAETFRQFRVLVQQYQMDRSHPAVESAAGYLFKCQTLEGDIRGMIGNQYATYYTGAIMYLLILAGYADDPRIRKGFKWLLSIRQDDMGWTIPILTISNYRWDEIIKVTSTNFEPLEPDKTKPFSHNWTGMVLRAFAVHPTYSKSKDAKVAADLLKSRFFKKDVYSSYHAASYWTRFQYPFWWSNLLTALDSLSLMGYSKDDADIKSGLSWFIDNQQPDGLWPLDVSKKQRTTIKAVREQLWVALAICRMLKRFYE
ncbi:hypothetical protein ACFLXN_00375 [Chloroflexota bacterium]